MVCDVKTCPKIHGVKVRSLPNVLIDNLLTVSRPMITYSLLKINGIAPQTVPDENDPITHKPFQQESPTRRRSNLILASVGHPRETREKER